MKTRGCTDRGAREVWAEGAPPRMLLTLQQAQRRMTAEWRLARAADHGNDWGAPEDEEESDGSDERGGLGSPDHGEGSEDSAAGGGSP